jgi:hypothetical protein
LEEDVRAAIASPDYLVLLVVLDEKAVRGYVVTGDNQASVGGVVGPTDAVAVVGTPCPDVIQDGVVAAD